MSEKFEKLIKSFQYAVSAFLPGFSTDRQEIDNAHDAMVAYVTGLEAEVERLREEIDAIGKARHKDVLVLGGLYLKNQELTTRNLALAEDNIALRIEIDMLREAARWIPVSERLPEEGVAVIVKYESGYAIAFYKDGVWRRYSNWWIDGITLWRTLQPPEME